MNEIANSLLQSWIEGNFEYHVPFKTYEEFNKQQKDALYNEFVDIASKHYNDENEAIETFWAMLDEFSACRIKL